MKSAALLLTLALRMQAEDAGALRDRLDQYLLGYEPQLSTVVADEEMTQRIREQRWVVTHRRIHSEVAFIALPGSAGWMGFRRVVKVNGKTVKDRGVPLMQLMSEGAGDDYDQARLLLADSAAHNLGAPRTINLPNLPLELLHPRHRHRFAQEMFGREKIRGINTALLRFDEFSTPTIIQQPGAGDMKTVVWAWIEPASGRLLRAQVTARDIRIGMPSFDAVIRVDFRHDRQGRHAGAGRDERDVFCRARITGRDGHGEVLELPEVSNRRAHRTAIETIETVSSQQSTVKSFQSTVCNSVGSPQLPRFSDWRLRTELPTAD